MMFSNEPVVWMGLIRAAVVLAAAFGLNLTSEQTGAIYLMAEAVSMFVTRRNVVPNGLAEYRVEMGYKPTEKIEGDMKRSAEQKPIDDTKG